MGKDSSIKLGEFDGSYKRGYQEEQGILLLGVREVHLDMPYLPKGANFFATPYG
jgi:hypothetical protein